MTSFNLQHDLLSREAVEQTAKRQLNEAWAVVYKQGVDDGLDLTYKLATFLSGQRHIVNALAGMPARQAAKWLQEQTGAPIVSCRSVVRIVNSVRR